MNENCPICNNKMDKTVVQSANLIVLNCTCTNNPGFFTSHFFYDLEGNNSIYWLLIDINGTNVAILGEKMVNSLSVKLINGFDSKTIYETAWNEFTDLESYKKFAAKILKLIAYA